MRDVAAKTSASLAGKPKSPSKGSPACAISVVHPQVLTQVQDQMPPEESLYDVAEFFKVFGDTTRVRLLYALRQAEMCVCDLAALLGMSQSAVSHQLRILKINRLVKYRRSGKSVYYSLDDEHVNTIIDMAVHHLQEGNR